MSLKEAYVVGSSDQAIREATMGQLLQEAATAYPDRVAIIHGVNDPAARRQWTFAQLLEDATAVAHALAAKFKPGERIAIWSQNTPEWVMLEFGSAMAGTILVTVNPSFQAEELAYVLKQSRSSGLFVMPEYRGNRMLNHVEAVRADCPELREVVRFDEWDAFIAPGRNSESALPAVQPQDAVMIQYTSGTTGFPKGALLHHRGLVNNAIFCAHSFRDGDVLMGYMPFFHTGGCVLGVLSAVAKNSTLVIVEQFEAGLVLELIESYGAANIGGVPTMLIALIEHPDFPRRDLSTIRTISSGGSTVPAALVKRFEEALGAPFTIVFGQTETSPVSSMTLPGDSLEDKANTIGGPVPNVEIKIIDPETGATVPVNTLGEYCTRGFHVMTGYFEMPEATAATIDAEGWLHTGDLCSMDERGYCKVEGRLKDMIIRGGENIYPREIEDLLFKYPSVSEVAVVGLPSERMGEEVGAFIRAAPGESVDRNALITYLREHLSPQKTPRHWFRVEEFPLTGSGKIQKFTLRKQWEAGQHREI